MSENPEADAYIGAGASLLGTAGNIAAAAAADKRGRKWAEKQYNKQRADSLADWAMQNDYNSPAAQMARLTKANLNPRLMYGAGSSMPAASSVGKSDTGSYKPVVPDIDLQSPVNTLLSQYDLRMKKAQTDNLEEQKHVIIQDGILKAQQTAASAIGTAKTTFDLDQAQKLSSNTLEQAKANLQKTYADTAFTLDTNERAAAMQASSLTIAAENILTIRAQRAKTSDERKQINQSITNAKSDNELKQLDIQLKKMGVQPNDPAWMRILTQYLDTGKVSGGGVNQIIENIDKKLPPGAQEFLRPLYQKPGAWRNDK